MDAKITPIRKVPDIQALLDEIATGQVELAALVYRRQGEPCWQPLTDSYFSDYGWLFFSAAVSCIGEEGE